MEIIIFEKKQIEDRSWYLCKGNLIEYLDGLKTNFYEYAIQRRIVKNQYLDKIYSTIQAGDPLPNITLTYKDHNIHESDANKGTIDLSKTEILDGLQRTFRLWAHLFASRLYTKEKTDYRTFAKSLKRSNPLLFESGVMSTELLKTLIETDEINKIQILFEKYDIYFTLWAGLTEKEVIQKMLLLNAGQKSVSKTHQFELLFIHFFDIINEKSSKIKVFREKDPHSEEIKRGNRSTGQFMFSSIIVALQSLVEGKPLRISTDKLIESEFETDLETPDNIYNSVFNKTYLSIFLHNLFTLDDSIFNCENNKGREWFSKDTTLSGVFAAIGKMIDFEDLATLDEQTKLIFQKLIKAIGENGLCLEEFTDEYNVLSSRSVNIGSFIRKVVMEYITALLEGQKKSWKSIFNQVKGK